jgi:hypothetical protein
MPCEVYNWSWYCRRHYAHIIYCNRCSKSLDSVDVTTRRVGIKINRAKTEIMMVGNWSFSLELRVSRTINQVKDFKYLGSWLLYCTKDFEGRRALAWKAYTRLVKVWKSTPISNSVESLSRIDSTIQCCHEDSYWHPVKKVRWLLHETNCAMPWISNWAIMSQVVSCTMT